MKLSVALAALLFAPAAHAGCVNVLDNSWFEQVPQTAWYQGSLPSGSPLGFGGLGCAVLNDNASGSGIPLVVEPYFVKGGGTLRNAIANNYDLAQYFAVRNFSEGDGTGDANGDESASLICFVTPITFPQDKLIWRSDPTLVIQGPDYQEHDVTALLQEAKGNGDAGGSLYLDARSPEFGQYQVSFWDDVELWICPPGSGISGDPHIKTWSGSWYDFHGLCDLVLVSNDEFEGGLGLDIHVRAKGRHAYSFIETAAIRIGDDVLEVGSWGQVFYNGVESADMEDQKMAGKFKITHTKVDKKHTVTEIDLGGLGESIVIKTFKDMVNVIVEGPTDANFGKSHGLMGSFPEGKLVARDGATIMDDPLLFGQEWMVSEGEPKLFVAPSEHVGACVPPPAVEDRRLGESISDEDAEKACAHLSGDLFDMCVFDVKVTADMEAADMHGAF